jgi:hypothetical protein
MRRWVFQRIKPVRNSRGRRIPEIRSFWFSQVFLWPPFANNTKAGELNLEASLPTKLAQKVSGRVHRVAEFCG